MEKQVENQIQVLWRNRFQSWDRDSLKLPSGAKRKEEATQVINNLAKRKEKEKLKQKQDELDEQQDNVIK